VTTVPKLFRKILGRCLSKNNHFAIIRIAHTNDSAKKFLEINMALADKVICRKLPLHHREFPAFSTGWPLNFLTLQRELDSV
jgi:hypothetical protein